ncbi:MAG TPA: bifunctional diaminohydroxyphosphoribosylaminopyrimidine deaminase/5-amino-6-(5-phosphoribosylamino)uracil reductase RibD [Rhizomicrobium sp.]|nr:bifunctional diaminohydroxyphosphoribosylaminopyrimidine deaminase/5-amino-6-(5-phosphoribosylamino)uracil reductase RibD [Rhizomicrobium sp.]
MHHALRLAARGLGRVAPNPAVGCVIVAPDGRVVGRGWTQDGGQPHAETMALAEAGALARGATAYVTLEPCAHFGMTPPCSDALIAAGVARVVAAVEDPDPRVKGQGFAKLRAAGIAVETGVLETQAADLNRGFFLRVTENRPLVTLKIAQSADRKTVPPPGASRWITSEAARRYAHLLRARHDAVLVGVNTVIADDPALTVRLPGLEKYSPLRVVLDRSGRMPKTARLAAPDTLVLDGDIPAVLHALAGRGVTRLLVEGGATIFRAFLDAGYADRIELFTAPLTLGEGAGGEVPNLAESPDFLRVRRRSLGPDTLESFARRA